MKRLVYSFSQFLNACLLSLTLTLLLGGLLGGASIALSVISKA